MFSLFLLTLLFLALSETPKINRYFIQLDPPHGLGVAF
jgi:hypothetical protein